MKKSELFAKLKDHLQLKNINQVPKIDKVIVSMGIGSLVTRKGHKDFEEFEKNYLETLPHYLQHFELSHDPNDYRYAEPGPADILD